MKFSGLLHEAQLPLFDRKSSLSQREKALDDIDGFSVAHDTAVAEHWFDDDYYIELDARKAGYVKVNVYDADGEFVEKTRIFDEYESMDEYIQKLMKNHK